MVYLTFGSSEEPYRWHSCNTAISASCDKVFTFGPSVFPCGAETLVEPPPPQALSTATVRIDTPVVNFMKVA
jgi:hypothetical protein